MMKTNLLFLFTAALLSAGINLHGGIKLKLATIVPKQSIWGKQFGKAVDNINKKTKGNVQIRIYYGSQGDEMKVVRKMRIGQLHGAGFLARGMSKICPDSLVFAIPTLFRNEEEAIAMHKKMEGYFQKEAASRGYEILGWSNQGFTYCFSKDPVTNLSQLRQAKPWMLENDEFCKSFFKCSSISAVPAQVGDLMTALQTGMIRTVFSPPIGMILMQWYTKVNYMLDLGLFYSFGAVVINTKQWRKLPAEYQKIVRKEFRDALQRINTDIKKQNADAIKVMSKTIKILKPSEEALREFREVTKKVEADMTGKAFSPEAMKLLKSYLKEYRAGKE